MSYFVPTEDVIIRELSSFYKNFKNTSFKEISGRKLIELKSFSKELNSLFNNQNVKEFRISRYIKVMNKIKTNPKAFNIETTSDAEKYLLFMFAIDPEFEIYIIHNSENRKSQIKEKIENKFGLYDPYLLAIEKFYIKNFLPQEKRIEINKKIIERSYYPEIDEKRIFK